MATSVSELVRMDLDHLIHPMHHSSDLQDAQIFTKGRGAMLTDARGREVIDGLAGLWNVTLGHGQTELVQAAAEQMSTLAYSSTYVGYSNEPAIRLAAKIIEKTYPNMESVYFTTAGAESNESAFKTARFYWKTMGKPDKVKVISRRFGYHGVTMATMSAPGMPAFHENSH